MKEVYPQKYTCALFFTAWNILYYPIIFCFRAKESKKKNETLPSVFNPNIIHADGFHSVIQGGEKPKKG